MDILNGVVVEERFEVVCGFFSCCGYNDVVFLYFFLDVYGGDSKRFGFVGC